MLDPEKPALYPNAVLEVRPLLSPDFTSLSVEVFVYFEKDDGEGGKMLEFSTSRRIQLTTGDMTTDEPHIAQTLDTLSAAVMKTLIREFQPYNETINFQIKQK